MTTSTDQDLLAAVAELLYEIAEVPIEDVKPESSFKDDLDVDSLLMVEFGIALEDRFGVAIPDEDFSKVRTVSALLELLLTRWAPERSAPGGPAP